MATEKDKRYTYNGVCKIPSLSANLEKMILMLFQTHHVTELVFMIPGLQKPEKI